MRILMLEPYADIQGPLPRIVPLLTDALRKAGCTVKTAQWGRHRDVETFRDKLFGRVADIWRVWRALAKDPCDILYVVSAHDWRTVVRDLPLLLLTRGRYD